MTPELKRAIIKVAPAYFAWDEKRQEQYRVNTPEEDDFRIKQYLLKSLFDISVSNDDEMKEAWGEMNEAQYLKINSALLPINGTGEDSFYLNESFSDEKSLLTFETLYDYDLDDHTFQEEAREKDVENYERKQYKGTLYFTWARLMIDGAFSYATLCMLAGCIYSELDEYGGDYIDKLIPHEYKHGKNHGKTEGPGYLLDLKIDAKGLESHLEVLQHRYWEHMRVLHDRLADEFDQNSIQRVFILDQSKADDPNQLFLFSDKEILKRIHFKTFMRDCRAVEQTDHSSISRKLEEEKPLLTKFLDAQYNDIMENLDPKIIKFRKKRKVVIHKDSGLDELLD